VSRILRLELRRSAALGAALILTVVGVLALYFAEGIGFAEGWMQLAMGQRIYLALLWPLALAAGAWQGTRERRSRVTELFASAPRPNAERVLPTIGAMAIAVIGAYLLVGLAGGLWIVGTARYLPVAFFAVTAVGVLALLAGVWLGLAVGRALPWLATAPALAIAGLGLLLALPGMTRPHGWLALVFSPIYEMNMPDAYTTVPGRVSLSQALWLGALAITAVMLFASSGWRLRVAALLPVVVGAGLAIAVMPQQNRQVIASVDKSAQELVCAEEDPRICVSRVHQGLFSEFTPAAQQALTAMAKLPDGPTRVHEDTTTYVPDVYAPWDTGVALVTVEVGTDAHLEEPDQLAAKMVQGAFASLPDCDKSAAVADQFAAAYWLIGTEPKPAEIFDPDERARTVDLWHQLNGLPEAEALAKVSALRADANACRVEGGLFGSAS
jgi:hypothetical protein